MFKSGPKWRTDQPTFPSLKPRPAAHEKILDGIFFLMEFETVVWEISTEQVAEIV